MNKKYLLEVFLDDEMIYREKTEGRVGLTDMRLLVSALEEAKIRLLNTIMLMQKQYNIKDKLEKE